MRDDPGQLSTPGDLISVPHARLVDDLVELLQDAMDRDGAPFGWQSRFLAKFAPMKCDVVKR